LTSSNNTHSPFSIALINNDFLNSKLVYDNVEKCFSFLKQIFNCFCASSFNGLFFINFSKYSFIHSKLRVFSFIYLINEVILGHSSLIKISLNLFNSYLIFDSSFGSILISSLPIVSDDVVSALNCIIFNFTPIISANDSIICVFPVPISPDNNIVLLAVRPIKTFINASLSGNVNCIFTGPSYLNFIKSYFIKSLKHNLLFFISGVILLRVLLN